MISEARRKTIESEFETLLNENGVKMPRVFFKKRFEERVIAVRLQYARYVEAEEERSSQYVQYSKELNEHWETEEEIPVFEEEKFYFRSLDEFEKQLIDATKKVKDDSAFSWYMKADKKLRKAWVAELVAQATEECKLIVIKGAYTPYDFNVQKFNQYVTEKKSAVISVMGISPIWIAFNPHEEYDTQYWCMYGSNSKVEFVK